MKAVFKTPRLCVRLAVPADAALIHQLWTDPRVMKHVGFPQGLKITQEEVRRKIKRAGEDVYRQLLIVVEKAGQQVIGQCKMGQPDENGIAETDIKLLPEFWGRKYGVEVKRGMVDYLFVHTDCKAVGGTPNVDNLASIKMQEAVGAVRVGEEVYRFPEQMRDFTCPVHHYIYHVNREIWEKDLAERRAASVEPNGW
ncbi:MAG: GNAT family N-acetyltransferase [Anaerolineales bacterium]|nr:GNAT family N-acetyltransferase [Anaerolineales bacterium]